MTKKNDRENKMNSRERVLNILSGKQADRIPVDLWYTPEVGLSLRDYFGVKEDTEWYSMVHLDKIVWINADYPVPPERSVWGTSMKKVDTGRAVYYEYDKPGLSNYNDIESLDDYPFWPQVNNYNYSNMARQAQSASANYATLGPWTSLYEIYCSLRGLEQSMMDLVMAPDYVQKVLDKIEDCQIQMLRRFLNQASGYVDMVFISDDMGSQNGLLMSLDMWDTFFKERLKRMCDLIHSYRVKVFYHSDGAVEPLISRLIDCGIDVLNPIQHVCPGMDMGRLKHKYGSRVVFHGGVDNQSVLPFGTKEAVREETLNCLRSFASDKKGYIGCSCHNVQSGTPVENIVEMIETVKTFVL